MKLIEFSKLVDEVLRKATKFSLLESAKRDDKLKEELDKAVSIAQERIIKEILEKIDLNQMEI